MTARDGRQAGEPDFLLVRDAVSDYGIFGVVTVGALELQTVEQPWRSNQPEISCIPAGDYELAPRRYFRGGYDAIEILDVPDRWPILFHRANWPLDVQGCVGTGLMRGNLRRKKDPVATPAILSSEVAHTQLMAEFNRRRQIVDGIRRLWLRIEYAPGRSPE